MSRFRDLSVMIIMVAAFSLGLMLFGGCTLINHPPVPAFTVYPTHGVAPLYVVVDATASSDPDGDTLTFSWDFGDGVTATGATAGHTYHLAGKYTIALHVADGRGAEAAATTTIKVSAPSSNGGNPPPPPAM